MMALRVTPTTEKEGAEVEGAEEEGGMAEAVGSSVSTRGRFGRSWALLGRTKLALMAPILVKKGEKGMGM